jgi:colicin import membrane protein
MRVLGLLALAGILACAGCGKPQLADPTPVLASQSDLDRMRQAIAPCLRKAWLSSVKGRQARVTLRWRLDEDGMLVGDPELVDPRDGEDSLEVQAAMRAVQACEPFRLPVSQYHLWKETVFTFDAAARAN